MELIFLSVKIANSMFYFIFFFIFNSSFFMGDCRDLIFVSVCLMSTKCLLSDKHLVVTLDFIASPRWLLCWRLLSLFYRVGKVTNLSPFLLIYSSSFTLFVFIFHSSFFYSPFFSSSSSLFFHSLYFIRDFLFSIFFFFIFIIFLFLIFHSSFFYSPFFILHFHFFLFLIFQ